MLVEGGFHSALVDVALRMLADGSKAAPGYPFPEGIVIYHVAGNLFFKKTLEKDEEPKGDTKPAREAVKA